MSYNVLQEFSVAELIRELNRRGFSLKLIGEIIEDRSSWKAIEDMTYREFLVHLRNVHSVMIIENTLTGIVLQSIFENYPNAVSLDHIIHECYWSDNNGGPKNPREGTWQRIRFIRKALSDTPYKIINSRGSGYFLQDEDNATFKHPYSRKAKVVRTLTHRPFDYSWTAKRPYASS